MHTHLSCILPCRALYQVLKVTVKDNKIDINNSLFDCIFSLLFSICVLVPKEFSVIIAVASVIFCFTLSSGRQGNSGDVNRLAKSRISWKLQEAAKAQWSNCNFRKTWIKKKNGQHCNCSNANSYFLQMDLFILSSFSHNMEIIHQRG